MALCLIRAASISPHKDTDLTDVLVEARLFGLLVVVLMFGYNCNLDVF